jgi:hypothetical protein
VDRIQSAPEFLPFCFLFSFFVHSNGLLYYYETYITLLENVNKSRTSAGNLSLRSNIVRNYFIIFFHLQVSLVKNGQPVDRAHASNTPNVNEEQGSTHAALHLAAGEQVWIRQEYGDGIRGSYWTFTGYLIHTD